MIVCHCRAISDRTVRALACQGASTAGEILQACAAGGDCGGCRPVIEHLLKCELHRAEPRPTHQELVRAS